MTFSATPRVVKMKALGGLSFQVQTLVYKQLGEENLTVRLFRRVP